MTRTLDLDANADALVLPAAWQAYREATADFGNPSSRHALGRAAKKRFDQARTDVACAIGASANEIVFTSGGTEADALAILGTMAGVKRPHVVTTAIEHAAVARTLDDLEARGLTDVSRVRSGRDGRVEPGAVLAEVGPETRLVTVVMACNETGVVQPIDDIAVGCRERRVPIHTDAVQAFGRISVDVRELGVDLLSLSGHKLGAVGGIGVLYVRHGTAVQSVIVGGGHEEGRRASTENVAGAASLAAALGELPRAADLARTMQMRDRLEEGLAAALGAVEILGQSVKRLPNTTCIRFDRVEGDAIMMALDLDGIVVSTGSACSSGSVEPSPILLGMGLSAIEARQTVRFSLGRAVDEDDIDATVRAVRDVVARIRNGGG